MMNPRDISIQQFTYDLPKEKIALHPLPERDASKLLVYKNGEITEDLYKNISDYLSSGSLLIFNDSKVINARILFKNAAAATIEIFCLEPLEQINEYSSVMTSTGPVKWKCLVGGAAKWKENKLQKKIIIDNKELLLEALMIEKINDEFVIEFSWNSPQYNFGQVIESAGNVPLPPYIKRNAEVNDTTRYQTIYASIEGSVAAPTAGLHFTETVFEKLNNKKIEKDFVTLHVSAGTFKPVKSSSMDGHEMHPEWIDISIETIRNIFKHKEKIIAVGTTSLRTIETLYWIGVKISFDPTIKDLHIDQWELYEEPMKNFQGTINEALQSLIHWMEGNQIQRIFTYTKLLIVPGYKFKIAKAIVTNFHQPQSTLLLLVAAAIGDDWKKIYNYALEHDYRFLSYGDGNLIFMAE